jgi:hypothetical protein
MENMGTNFGKHGNRFSSNKRTDFFQTWEQILANMGTDFGKTL